MVFGSVLVLQNYLRFQFFGVWFLHCVLWKKIANYHEVVTNIDGHRHLWSAGRGQLDVPRVRLSTYGGRAFCYAGPSAWNALPVFLKTVHFLYLLLDVSWNIFTSHSTSTPSAFEVFLQLMRYINYLLTYLLTARGRPWVWSCTPVLVACPTSCSSVSKNSVVVRRILSEQSDIIFIKLDQHLEKLSKENKGLIKQSTQLLTYCIMWYCVICRWPFSSVGWW